MTEEYVKILSNVLEYERTSKYEIILCFISLLALILFLLIKAKKTKVTKPDKIFFGIGVIIIFVLFCIWVPLSGKLKQQINMDISNRDFLTYQGEFIVHDYINSDFYIDISIINDSGEKKTLRYPDRYNIHNVRDKTEFIDFGEFKGTVVYGKKSEIVVKCKIIG